MYARAASVVDIDEPPFAAPRAAIAALFDGGSNMAPKQHIFTTMAMSASFRLTSRTLVAAVGAPGARAFAVAAKPMTVAQAVAKVKEGAKVRC